MVESSKRFSSDVLLRERKPNQCSSSLNGTLTLKITPFTRTRTATYWQRQRGTRNRLHLASNLCTGSCGEAGSPHTPKKLINMPGCRNAREQRIRCIRKHHPPEDRISLLTRVCDSWGKTQILRTLASDGCATSRTQLERPRGIPK